MSSYATDLVSMRNFLLFQSKGIDAVKITVGLSESNGSLTAGLRLQSPAD